MKNCFKDWSQFKWWWKSQMSYLCDNWVNWCPVIVSIRQQVSPILSLAVNSLLVDQWDGMLGFMFSVGCKLLNSYDILLILINKQSEVLRKKNKYTLRYWITDRNLVDFIVSKALMNHPLDHPQLVSQFRVTSPRSRLSRDSRWWSGFWPSG